MRGTDTRAGTMVIHFKVLLGMKYLLVGLVVLAGCSGQRVKDLPDGLHAVSACSDDALINPQVTATRSADQYCEKTGQQAVVSTFDTQACPGTNFSTTRVVFACR
jgi:hypothetical protein